MSPTIKNHNEENIVFLRNPKLNSLFVMQQSSLLDRDSQHSFLNVLQSLISFIFYGVSLTSTSSLKDICAFLKVIRHIWYFEVLGKYS